MFVYFNSARGTTFCTGNKGVNRSIKYKKNKVLNIYWDFNIFSVVSFTMKSEINNSHSKFSSKPWCGLVRAPLNFVGALSN